MADSQISKSCIIGRRNKNLYCNY